MYEIMGKVRKLLRNRRKTFMMLNSLALIMVIQNVNVTCGWLMHQPEIPDEAKKFRKLK